MTAFINIQSLGERSPFEMAERKGVGHPDTICDRIAEQLSIALARYYLKHFGSILHYNVDKALLVGGKSSPAYRGGKILEPMELYIAGRATSLARGKVIPVDEIAVQTAKSWLSSHLRFLDVDTQLRIIPKIRTGSSELVALFERFGKGEVPLANDTSFGVGYYPYSSMEKMVLDMETSLNSKALKERFPFVGEDIKVMGVQGPDKHEFTIAMAFVDRFVNDLDDYRAKKQAVKDFVSAHFNISPADIQINTADNYQQERIYLTVTGSSAEGGDDGQVGRGNRVNGLITPYRPMSLEASDGKNPVSHIGKIYNHFAFDLSRALVEEQLAAEAEVYIVSRIGKPIDQPQLLHIRLKERAADQAPVTELVKAKLATLPRYWEKIIGISDRGA